MFNDEIWKPLVYKLSWTIFLILMPLDDNNKMYYYANQCLLNNLSNPNSLNLYNSDSGISVYDMPISVKNFI